MENLLLGKKRPKQGLQGYGKNLCPEVHATPERINETRGATPTIHVGGRHLPSVQNKWQGGQSTSARKYNRKKRFLGFAETIWGVRNYVGHYHTTTLHVPDDIALDV